MVMNMFQVVAVFSLMQRTHCHRYDDAEGVTDEDLDSKGASRREDESVVSKGGNDST